MAPLAVLVKLTARPGRADDLQAVLTRFAEQAAGEAGTMLYAVNRDAGDGAVFWCAEMFASAEAFEAHRSADTVAALLPALDDMVAAREILRGHVVAAAGVQP